MSKTNIGLVEYAIAQLGKPYWYGTFGQLSTKSLYTYKKKQYPSYYEWKLPENQLGVKVHDCVGLIKGYLWCTSPTDGKPKYNAKQDVSANGMYTRCEKKGDFATMPDVKGVLVFKSGHVGVYIGGGYVVEAHNHAKGVIKTKLSSGGWKHWGYCPWIEYKNESAPSKPAKKPTTNKGYSNGAEYFNKDYRNGKKYTVNATHGLRLRKIAGNGDIITVMPYGSAVMWYGYYSKVSGVVWRYVQFKHNGETYTGFCSSEYLK